MFQLSLTFPSKGHYKQQYYRKRLKGGTVPLFKWQPGGTVPPFKMNPGGTVPTFQMHPGGTLKFNSLMIIFLDFNSDCID